MTTPTTPTNEKQPNVTRMCIVSGTNDRPASHVRWVTTNIPAAEIAPNGVFMAQVTRHGDELDGFFAVVHAISEDTARSAFEQLAALPDPFATPDFTTITSKMEQSIHLGIQAEDGATFDNPLVAPIPVDALSDEQIRWLAAWLISEGWTK